MRRSSDRLLIRRSFKKNERERERESGIFRKLSATMKPGGIGSIRMQWSERPSHAAPTSQPAPDFIVSPRAYRLRVSWGDLFLRILTFVRGYRRKYRHLYHRVDPHLDAWNRGRSLFIFPIPIGRRKRTPLPPPGSFARGLRWGRSIGGNSGNCFR